METTYIYVQTLEHYSLLALNTNVSYFFSKHYSTNHKMYEG